MSKHLDLGCGSAPRNPYQRDLLFGVDLAGSSDGGPIRQCNLALQPIPFPDSEFESVSAYDFLEHLPRVLATADQRATRFPFVELMNEVWRVLQPGGLFYASTPVYPHAAAFQDPTHVNFITANTHDYFVRPQRMAAMYGFGGDFLMRRVQLARPDATTLYVQPMQGWWAQRQYERRRRRHAYSHVVWEFEAVK